MPSGPNKLSQFWQELKRRKVFRVVAMYAGVAYIIIELISNVADPLHLPEWTATVVILLLIVGFPVVAILSWIFDITPEGLTKTEDAEHTKDPSTKTGKKSLKLSDLIIAVLVIVVIILAYPRVFKNRASLNAMTYPVTVVNEFGEKETHRIFKKDYLIPIATFPFSNETGNSSMNWMQSGIQEGIYRDLRQFKYMSVRWDDANILQEQIEYANTHNYPHFITGSFRINHDIFEISSRLYQSANGLIVAENNFRGSDFFDLIDSISLQARIDLNISRQLLNSSPDLTFKEYYTDNFDAFRYLIYGLDFDSIYFNLNKAIQLDPTFALAFYLRANQNYNYQASQESAHRDINQAMNYRKRLLPHYEIGTRILYYQIQGDKKKAIALAEMEHDLYPNDVRILQALINTYRRNFMCQEEEKALLVLNELVPDRPNYQLLLAEVYVFTGKLNKGQVILEKLLKDDPRNTRALFRLGEIYLHQNDLDHAEELYNRVRLFYPEQEAYCLTMLDHCAYMRANQDNRILHEQFVGIYREEDAEFNDITFIHNNHLVARGENQSAIYRYPISDKQYISAYISGGRPVKSTFSRNSKGKVIKVILEQNETYTLWKEDSLILKAREHLENGLQNEALSAFRKAYDQNPEHYYLSNYIQHLEYIQSPEYEESKTALKLYSGKYGNLKLFHEDDQFYYENFEGLIYKLLPIDEDQFMIPSDYTRQIQFDNVNGSLSGLKFVSRDGNEEYFAKGN